VPVHSSGSPFVVAHRAANDLRLLRRAQTAKVALIEGDVQLVRGRLEVRHRTTVGPLPILWPHWRLSPPAREPLLLASVLIAAGHGGELMLDLKGTDPRLPDRVRTAIADHSHAPRVTVCSRHWPHLGALRDVPRLRLVHSVGSGRELRALLAMEPPSAHGAVSIRHTLIDRTVVAALRSWAELVFAWPVEDVRTARNLVDLGVDGIISRNFLDVAAGLGLLGERTAGEHGAVRRSTFR